MKSPFIDDVNKMIDLNASIGEVKKYLDSKGFIISKNYIGKYRQIKKTLSVEEQNIDKFIEKSPVAKLIEKQEKDLASGSAINKLKNDLEFLDMVIQSGSDQLKNMIAENEYIITVDNVFKAIELKDKLTDGALKGFTEFGIKNLQEITENKYMELLKYTMKYVPKDKQADLLSELEDVEEDFYKATDYYEDYLRSIGKTEKEIQKKLKEIDHD